MENKNETLKKIRMTEVEATEIRWLWYPYILFEKITAVQGELGDGKTTAVLVIDAADTTGTALTEQDSHRAYEHHFPNHEDGLDDTVKPRLVQFVADCERVIVIDKSEKEFGQYFGKDKTLREMKDQIMKLLDEWKGQQKDIGNTHKK